MEDKKIILQRKQASDFTVNYPYGDNGRIVEYKFMGTKGNRITERPVPLEVFEWLNQSTCTFTTGQLIIKPTDDEDVNYTKEAIENIEEVEKSIFTKEEIVKMLGEGNHNSLKKALKGLTEGKTEDLVKIIQKQVTEVATEVGIDSSAKRKAICEWAGLDFEDLGDILFQSQTE